MTRRVHVGRVTLKSFGEILDLASRFDYRCVYCGKPVVLASVGKRINQPHHATRDHFVPKAKGGTRMVNNTVLACYKCNNEKGDSTPEEYALLLYFRRLAKEIGERC